MSNNPYQQGHVSSHQLNQPLASNAKQMLFGPSLALMIVAGISIAVFACALLVDIFFLFSGVAENLPEDPDDPISRVTTIWIRFGGGLLLLLIHAYVAWGAYNMMQLKRYSIARTASIVAVIPCISPCYLLGIPFGIWALVVLGKPGIRASFKS